MKKIIAFFIRFVPRKYLQRFSGIGLRIIGLFYAGNGVACPVCEKSYRVFLPYGRIKQRPNALCPSCLSLERHRLIWLYLKHKTSFFDKPQHVLHVAPEACFMKPFEKLHGDGYITADIESPLAKVKMDIHKIPFDENTFDAVLCNHVLEHVESDIIAMKEIYRVLKPGGFAILQVPFIYPIPDVTIEDPSIKDPRQREVMFGQDDHVRKYGHDYPTRIAEAGLHPIADEYANTLSEAEIHRYGIVKSEIIYVGKKR
jgi:SAM-dependent methyltransferase